MMHTPLEQDAHDTLMAYEARQAFISAEKARWVRTVAASKPCTGPSWAPVMNEQQKKEHAQYVIDNKLPF